MAQGRDDEGAVAEDPRVLSSAVRGVTLGAERYVYAISPPSRPSTVFEGLRRGFREAGYIEGQNVAIDSRWANNRRDRLTDLAAELVKLRADVLVCITTAALRAAKHATSMVPIVMAGIGDPVASGLIQSLARPGGHITAVTSAPGPGFNAEMRQSSTTSSAWSLPESP